METPRQAASCGTGGRGGARALAAAWILLLGVGAAGAAELPQGLLLHLSFDEWRTDSVPDQSGRGNGGRGAGVKWVSAAKQGGGCEFAATGCNVRVPNSPSLNPGRVTVAAWLKATAESRERRVLGKGDDGFALELAESGKPRFRAGSQGCQGDAVAADGAWRHVAATFDGDALKLYVDGVAQKQTAAWHGTIASNSAEVVVGMRGCDPKLQEKEPSFAGVLDEVMIFDHALTPAEVQAVMAYIKPKFTKSQVAQRLNELKDLLDRGLILQDFYDRKVKECESGQ